jgi:hypothetical protein
MNKKIIIFIGNMGSGKSEIAINYSFFLQKESTKKVKLIDLDIIKPYIRIRDVSEKIKLLGIQLIMPEEKLRNADMPIIPHNMLEYLTDPSFDLVMDVGGEERGCITIAQFKEYFEKTDLSVNLVINPFRPFSNSEEKILHMIESLQVESKLSITGLVSNPHLRFDTTIEQVIEGTNLVEKVSKSTNLPIEFISIWHKIVTNEFMTQYKKYKVLPLRLYLTFPWENGLIVGM